MSEIDVAAIREALTKATPGPWSAADEHGNWEESKPAWCVSRLTKAGEYVTDVAYIPQDMGVPEGQPCPQEQADAELIALLRNNAEALLDALERAQAASEGVDMLIAAAERRGAVKALEKAVAMLHSRPAEGFVSAMAVSTLIGAIERGADL